MDFNHVASAKNEIPESLQKNSLSRFSDENYNFAFTLLNDNGENRIGSPASVDSTTHANNPLQLNDVTNSAQIDDIGESFSECFSAALKLKTTDSVLQGNESDGVINKALELQQQQQELIVAQRAEEKRRELEQEIHDLIYNPQKPKAFHYAPGQKSKEHPLHIQNGPKPRFSYSEQPQPFYGNQDHSRFAHNQQQQPSFQSPYDAYNSQHIDQRMPQPPRSHHSPQYWQESGHQQSFTQSHQSTAGSRPSMQSHLKGQHKSHEWNMGQNPHMKDVPPVTCYDGPIYQVQFKMTMRDFIPAPSCYPQTLEIGEFVIVETDNGEDLGVVTGTLSMNDLIQKRLATRTVSVLDEEDGDLGRILRIAVDYETQQLPLKFHDESLVVKTVVQIAEHTLFLPLRIVEAEYQFDRQKLMIYYSSSTRVEFKELIKSLFSIYKTRIWFKKTNTSRPFLSEEYAAMSLVTGQRLHSLAASQSSNLHSAIGVARGNSNGSICSAGSTAGSVRSVGSGGSGGSGIQSPSVHPPAIPTLSRGNSGTYTPQGYRDSHPMHVNMYGHHQQYQPPLHYSSPQTTFYRASPQYMSSVRGMHSPHVIDSVPSQYVQAPLSVGAAPVHRMPQNEHPYNTTPHRQPHDTTLYGHPFVGMSRPTHQSSPHSQQYQPHYHEGNERY